MHVTGTCTDINRTKFYRSPDWPPSLAIREVIKICFLRMRPLNLPGLLVFDNEASTYDFLVIAAGAVIISYGSLKYLYREIESRYRIVGDRTDLFSLRFPQCTNLLDENESSCTKRFDKPLKNDERHETKS